jgi:hypothetical protein
LRNISGKDLHRLRFCKCFSPIHAEATKTCNLIFIPFSGLCLCLIFTSTDSACVMLIRYNFKSSNRPHVCNYQQKKRCSMQNIFMIYIYTKFNMCCSIDSLVNPFPPNLRPNIDSTQLPCRNFTSTIKGIN